jgi:mannose-6-phosphate isomerase-like protein (cupin superfamily)
MSFPETLIGRFSFDSVSFERVRAHGGREPILFCRAREGTATTAFNFVDLTIVPPGADIGRHTHGMDNEETYIVVSGQARMEVDGELIVVGPGDVIVNPPGGTHALFNPGPEALRLVVVELKTTHPARAAAE